MPDGMYNVTALIPPTTDFSLAQAIDHFRSLNAEMAVSAKGGSGFRVFFEDWAIVAWYSEGEEVRRENEDLAESNFTPFPVSAEVIASCDRELALWSDEDWDAIHTNHWISFVDKLIAAFPGMIVFDSVNGEWW